MAAVAGSMDSRRRSLDSTGCWPPLKWHSKAFVHQVLHARHPARRCADGWKTVNIERLRIDGGKAVKYLYCFEAHDDGQGLSWREVPAPAPQPGRPPLLDAAALIRYSYIKSMEAPRGPAAVAADLAAAPTAVTPDAAPAAAPASDPAADVAQVKSAPVGRPPLPPVAAPKDIKANAFPIWAVAPAARLLKAALSAPAAAADGRCSSPAAPAGGASTSAARDATSPATISLAAGAAPPPAPAAAADGCSSRPAATTGNAATSAARDTASPATPSLAADAPMPPAPATDAGCSSGGSGFAPHVRKKLQQLLQAAPQAAATAAPGARPETAVAAPGSGTGAAAEVHRSKLRAEAPPFVPRAALAKPSGGLRASAPVFLPQTSTVPAALSDGKLCPAAPTC